MDNTAIDDDDRPWVLPEFSTPEGIVGVGGDLRPGSLLEAYAHGIFPWFNPGDPIIWWSPDPRAIFDLRDFHVPRRLATTIKQNKFRVTTDMRFRAVMEGCAADREEGTWVTAEMIDAYTELHERGHAHSLEVWLGDDLVGGIYGVAVAPGECDEVDAADDPLVLAGPELADESHLAGTGFVEDGVVDDEDGFAAAEKRPDFVPDGFRIGFEPGQEPGEGVVGGGFGVGGLAAGGFAGAGDLGRGDEEIDVVACRGAGRIHQRTVPDSKKSRKGQRKQLRNSYGRLPAFHLCLQAF